jgi:hypothetical protein
MQTFAVSFDGKKQCDLRITTVSTQVTRRVIKTKKRHRIIEPLKATQ